MRTRLLVVLALCVAASCRHEAKRYNLLLVTLDTTRADRMGAYGYKAAETPNFDKLAARGLRFERAESAVPLTLPAHATILSGALPLHHGLRNNGAGTFPADRETLQKAFSRAGYRTGAFVAAFVLDHRFGLNAGFDTYDDDIPRDPASTSSFDAERSGEAVVDRAIAWLRGDAAKPFFAWVHLYDAHAPYAPREPFKSRHASQPYDGEIAYDDVQLGRLVAQIEAMGQLDSTIIAVVGDHGEALGDHGELTHGLLLYEPTLHVPLVIAAPGALAPRVVHTAVSAVDLAPTLASLAGAPFATKSDGRDLAATLRDGAEPPSADVYAETQYPLIFGWSELAALRRDDRKYIRSTNGELYDLGKDPGETHNVLTDERRAYRELSSRLETLRATATAASAKASVVDEETKAKLASLGYVAPAALSPRSGPLPDPVAMAPLFRAFEEATWATNAGRNDEAIAKLTPIVARDPRNPVFRGSLARALRQTGDLDRAIRLYQESVGINPEDAEAWYNLAVTLQEAGRAKEADVAIREAIRRDPKRPESHNALGVALGAAGKVDEARAEFEQAAAIDPHDPRAYNNIGNVARAAGRMDEAAAAYQRALQLAPSYVDPLNGLGVLAVQSDRPRDAIPYFDRALAIAPNFYEAQLNRGIALQLAGDRAAAAAQFRSLLAKLPPGEAFASQRRAATQLLSALGK